MLTLPFSWYATDECVNEIITFDTKTCLPLRCAATYAIYRLLSISGSKLAAKCLLYLSLGMRPMNASMKLSHLTSKYVYLCDVLQLMQLTAYLVHLAPNWLLNAKVHTYHGDRQVNDNINSKLTFNEQSEVNTHIHIQQHHSFIKVSYTDTKRRATEICGIFLKTMFIKDV